MQQMGMAHTSSILSSKRVLSVLIKFDFKPCSRKASVMMKADVNPCCTFAWSGQFFCSVLFHSLASWPSDTPVPLLRSSPLTLRPTTNPTQATKPMSSTCLLQRRGRGQLVRKLLIRNHYNILNSDINIYIYIYEATLTFRHRRIIICSEPIIENQYSK